MQASPFPSNPTSTATPTLAHQINSTTRRAHITLNKRIIQLLPLAVPPFANDASLYARGMSYILPLYRAFEACSSQLLARPPAPRTPLTEALADLHIPALERTRRLLEDLKRLSPSLLLPPSSSSPSSPLQKENDTEKRKRPTPAVGHRKTTSIDLPPLLAGLIARITTTIPERPHLLLAYTHIFYLALFSGGRYIRAQLRSADTFPEDGLRFWYFEGEGDGEVLKGEFKRRWEAVEEMLDCRQRGEVVEEAARVMESMIGVVGEIEGVVGSDGGEMRGGFMGQGGKTGIGVKDDASFDDDDNEKEKDDNDNKSGTTLGWPWATEKKLWRKEHDVSLRWLLLKHLLPMGLADLLSAAFGGLLGLSFFDGMGLRGLSAGPEGRSLAATVSASERRRL